MQCNDKRIWGGWLLRHLVWKYILLSSLCHVEQSLCWRMSLAVFKELCFELPYVSIFFWLGLIDVCSGFWNLFLWLDGPAFLARTASFLALNFAKASFSSDGGWSVNRLPVLIHKETHVPHMALLQTYLLQSKQAILHTEKSKAPLFFFSFTSLEV